MPVTREFRKTILKRAERDAKFRRQMLTDAVDEMLSGDIHTGKMLLRDYINATITFNGLANRLNISSKSIHRMLGPRGNPKLDNILQIIKILQDHEHIRLRVDAKREAA